MTAAGLRVVGIEARSPSGRARARRACPGVAVHGTDAALPAVHAVLLAIPDSELAACARALAPRLDPATRVVLHTSGLAPASALEPLAGRHRSIASMHPLVTFPSATGRPVALDGVVAAIEGEAAAVRAAFGLARTLGMRPVRIAADAKARYHAAAALAANLSHALVATAKEILVEAGFSPRAAGEALRPLVRGAVESATEADGMESLTGPLARGDARAVAAHLAALPEDAAAAYGAVARLALASLGSQRLLTESQIHELLRALTVIP